VVGLGLIGSEAVQPVGQFERAFHAAEKKELARVVHAGDQQGADGVQKAIESLLPNRIDGGWGVADSPAVTAALVEQGIALDVTPAWAVCRKKIAALAEYPLRKLYDDGVTLVLGSDMPLYYKTTLNELYQAAVQKDSLSIDELQDVALNGVRASFLDDEAKQALLDEFTEAYKTLAAEHQVAQAT
jgi:adenosine deaminase